MPEGCQRILSLYTVSSLWANIYPIPIKLFGGNGNPHLVDAGATWLCHNQIRLPERIGQFILDHKPLNLTAYVSSKKLRILKHERIIQQIPLFLLIFLLIWNVANLKNPYLRTSYPHITHEMWTEYCFFISTQSSILALGKSETSSIIRKRIKDMQISLTITPIFFKKKPH